MHMTKKQLLDALANVPDDQPISMSIKKLEYWTSNLNPNIKSPITAYTIDNVEIEWDPRDNLPVYVWLQTGEAVDDGVS